jgi:chemotaxis protein methyltransferase CheR
MSIAAADFTFIADLVRKHSAIVLEPGKEYLVETRLATLSRQEGFTSLAHLVADLRAHPANGTHLRVVEAMTTNETSFFRDVHPFDALRQSVLPELIAKRQAQRELVIWCAACSSGQEPYTIAMTIRQHFPALASWNIKIIATDLSTEILAKAKQGRYSQLEVNRGLPATCLVKYFRKVGTEWEIVDDIRRMVDLRVLNLAEAWPALPAIDLVFMRNVLIYFDVSTKKTILGRIRRVLRPDGYLFLGGAETTMNLDDAYKRVLFGKAPCYRVGP